MKANDKKLTKVELKSSVKLFENTSLFKSLTKVIFLAILVSFSTGLYIFADQVMMTKILPISKSNFLADTLNEIGWNNLDFNPNNPAYEFIKNFEDPHKTITSIIRVSNSAISPITVFCTALALFIGLGTSIPYSNALGKKDHSNIKEIWKNGFYNCLFISIIFSIILSSLIYVFINLQVKNDFVDTGNLEINKFLIAKKNISIKFAMQYSFIIVGFSIFNNFLMLFSSMLNSEGKNSIPTLVALFSNFLNIFLDFVLLYYTDVGMNGSAIATIISYVISNGFFIGYILWKTKTNETFLVLSDLKLTKFKVNWTIILLIVSVGSASLFRNSATAIFSFTQNHLFSAITNKISNNLDSSYYIDIMGAVTPIYNLFYSAIIGVIRGGRTVVSYNYGLKRNDNVLKAFWISTMMAVFYGLIFYLFVCPFSTSINALQGGFLWFFEITPKISTYNDAVLMLNIMMSQLIVFSLTVSGMLYFQSTQKPLNALLTSLMYGLFIGIPMLFIFSGISLAASNINFYLYAPLIISFLSGFIIMFYTVWYIYIRRPKIYFER